MKKTVITIFVCLLSGQLLAQAPTITTPFKLPAGSITFPIRWNGDTLNGRYEPQAALLVPVTLPGCKRTFYLQFDTGSPTSLLYRSHLQAILEQYKSLSALGHQTDTLINFSFKAGRHLIIAPRVPVIDVEKADIDWKNTAQPIIIGTLGTDLIDQKVAVFDYPRQQLMIADSLPTAVKRQPAIPFVYAMRRILLPANLKGRQTMLYFDTGSSAFELLTDKATCFKLAVDTNAVNRYPVQSWGATLIANSLASKDSIAIAGLPIPLNTVTWIEGASTNQVSQMMRLGIGGMTGNKLFMKHVLVLDTRRQQSWLLRPGR